jgi:hypothetical protein
MPLAPSRSAHFPGQFFQAFEEGFSAAKSLSSGSVLPIVSPAHNVAKFQHFSDHRALRVIFFTPISHNIEFNEG